MQQAPWGVGVTGQPEQCVLPASITTATNDAQCTADNHLDLIVRQHQCIGDPEMLSYCPTCRTGHRNICATVFPEKDGIIRFIESGINTFVKSLPRAQVDRSEVLVKFCGAGIKTIEKMPAHQVLARICVECENVADDRVELTAFLALPGWRPLFQIWSLCKQETALIVAPGGATLWRLHETAGRISAQQTLAHLTSCELAAFMSVRASRWTMQQVVFHDVTPCLVRMDDLGAEYLLQEPGLKKNLRRSSELTTLPNRLTSCWLL